MKQKIILFMGLFLIMCLGTQATMMTIDVPLKKEVYSEYDIGDDAGTTIVEIRDYNSNVIYKRFELGWQQEDNLSSSDSWTLTKTVEATDYCPDYQSSGQNMTETFYNMSLLCNNLISSINSTNNISAEVISSQHIYEELGICTGKYEILNSSLVDVKTEKDVCQDQLNNLKVYESNFNNCNQNLTQKTKDVTTYGFGGIILGAVACYLFLNKKKNQPSEADEGAEW